MNQLSAQSPASAPILTLVPDPGPLGLDARLHAVQGKWTSGLSPVGQYLAFLDWGLHLGNAPFHRLALLRSAAEQWERLGQAIAGEAPIVPPPGDHRFGDPTWQRFPFNIYSQAFLLAEEWLAKATEAVPGVNHENQRVVSFTARQMLDTMSPSNVPWMNPEVIKATAETGGRNFVNGFENMLSDLHAALSGHPRAQEGFIVGKDLAATPGKVVYRNELIELIQYVPATDQVGRTPVLIVPAWIMKYYILDLSVSDSLIGYLVAHGHTVFTISWRNPTEEMAETTLDDYRRDGVMAALDAVTDITGGAKVQACGYCLGGTLLTIAAAAMARDGDDRLESVTLFCAQTDFSEAGELQIFITDDQLAFLNDITRTQGYLDSRQMAGAFQLLRSNDLIWSRLIKSYLMGEREHANDLMAWNADGTRLPAHMHASYLKRLFLDNELAEGRFKVAGHPIAIRDIRVPMFVVSTERDHIAPWHSVYKILLMTEGDLTFVLTSGGHNAGVVSPPGTPRRHFRVAERPPGAVYIGPDEWMQAAPAREGSWWPVWLGWLDARNGGPAAPPPMGSTRYPALDDAPGRYVHEN